MSNFDKILKIVTVLGGLFVAFLWSGGVWEYEEGTKERINKITGSVSVIEFNNDDRKYYWRDAMSPIPK